jgi:CRISPR-associated protein Csd1
VSHPQAALVKMVLLSQQDAEQQEEGEELMSKLVQLDSENRDPAYLCGRLLAVLEEAQWAAMGRVNATIIDRYFGTASSAPASVFGRLLTGAQAHLSTLRRDWPAKGQSLQKRLEEVQAGLQSFPRTLTLAQQGLFMLGYYHQRAADRAERLSRRRSAAEGTETDSAPAAHGADD